MFRRKVTTGLKDNRISVNKKVGLLGYRHLVLKFCSLFLSGHSINGITQSGAETLPRKYIDHTIAGIMVEPARTRYELMHRAGGHCIHPGIRARRCVISIATLPTRPVTFTEIRIWTVCDKR